MTGKTRKPRGDAFDRALAGLVRLNRTKGGRDIVRQHREALASCLAASIGKP